MKLNIKAVVIAEAIVGAVLFVLCRAAFVLAPEGTLATLKYLTHIDWSPVTMPVTSGGFILGLIAFTFFLAVVGGMWAWIYNRVAEGARVGADARKKVTAGISHQYLHLQ